MKRKSRAFDKFNNWFIQTYRSILFLILDIFVVNFAAMFALILRFDFNIPDLYYQTSQKGILWMTVFALATNVAFGLYKSLWKYASVDELVSLFLSCAISTGVSAFFLNWIGISLPRTFFIFYALIIVFLMGGIRFAYRMLRYVKRIFDFKISKNKKRVLIYGAGKAGQMVLDEIINQDDMDVLPIGFIDDDKIKKKRRIRGLRVFGSREDLIFTAKSEKIEEIIIAMPSSTKAELKDITNLCKETKCKVKILPGMYELIDGRVDIKQIRDVSIEDLLGRDPVTVDMDSMCEFISGKTVLVTGGGGSIGSELCRQVIKYSPKKLIIFDIYENNAYDIQNELINEYKNIAVLIGSVRDERRMEEVFSEFRPELIFHAAAHKHVPLMEESPAEAFKNNTMGTYNVAKAAHKYKAEKMVLISTDKAVNPTNVMGATKRLAERVINAFDGISETEYVSVRFGNVLGSNGSVIPLFKKQIEAGGPVMVTHPDIYRFFMTIPEAVQLVIQAGAMAEGGEIFVLDMGESVKIITLAEDLIKLSGFEPYKDIDIEYSGLRPGEKLYEELLHEEEGLEKTKHAKIYVGKHIDENFKELEDELLTVMNNIGNSCKANFDKEFIINSLSRMVPTFTYTTNKNHREEIACEREKERIKIIETRALGKA